MNPKPILALVVVFCLLSVTASTEEAVSFPIVKGPYLGQKPPGMTPEIFAPGIVSTEKGWEAAVSFSPDGREFYFSKRETREGMENRILFMELTNGSWTRPAPAPFARDVIEYEAFVSPDGNRVFFNSDRPRPDVLDAKGEIWYAERGPGGWGEPKYLTTRINKGWVMFVTVAANNSLYFTAGYDRKFGIYRSEFAGGEYREPEHLPMEVNYLRGAHPFIAPDESYLIFDAQPEGMGKSQLFVSFRKDGKWTQAVKFGPEVNATLTENIANVSPDGKYLFFGRNNDIYWVDARVIAELRARQNAPGTSASAPQ
jgi:dipeptidyl aminopeptidase/acylaminoacyl peptidase